MGILRKNERFNRSAMGCYQPTDTAAVSIQSWYPWKTKEGFAEYNQRGIMGVSDRRTLAGFTGAISSIPNLPSVFPSDMSVRNMGQNTKPLSLGLEKARKDRYNGMLYRWYFRKCQKRGLDIGKTKRGKGTKVMAIADAHGLPIAIRTHGANTHEVKLVEKTIEARFFKAKPKIIIGDMAYESDPLDK